MTIQAVVTHSPFVVRRRTPGDSFDLIARQETMSQTLLIPGLSRLNPNKLFANGQPGGWADPYDLTRMWVDDAGTTPATIASLGTGIGRVVTKGNAITLTQANAADRPVWGRHPVSGIRNLITNSEVPNGTSDLSLSGNVTTAGVSDFGPLGSVNSISFGNNAVQRFAYLSFTPTPSTTYRVSVFVRMDDLSVPVVGGNTTTGDFSLVGFTALASAGITVSHVANNIYRVSATANAANSNNGWGVIKYTGQSAKTFRVTGFQVELGSTLSTYQRVTNRFDITEVGSPSLYYFSGNGVNQGWSSAAAVPFGSTNKITVWAALRKQSDAATGVVCELSTNVANPGTFALLAPSNVGANSYRFASTGTVTANAGTGVFAAAPDTASLVGEADIAAPLVRLSRNNTIVETSTASQGTGNYSNGNTLYVFRRFGGALPFNGPCYGLIIAGDRYDLRTVQRFADWGLKPRRLITA